MDNELQRAQRAYAIEPTPCNERLVSRALARHGVVRSIRVTGRDLWNMHYSALKAQMPDCKSDEAKLKLLKDVLRLLPSQDMVPNDAYMTPWCFEALLADIRTAWRSNPITWVARAARAHRDQPIICEWLTKLKTMLLA